MGDIHVNIYEESEFEGRISLIEQTDGTYKLDHHLADPDRIFYKNGNNIIDLLSNAFTHLTLRLK
jgi:hypothetical protein